MTLPQGSPARLAAVLLLALSCDGAEPPPSSPGLSPQEAEARAEALQQTPPPPPAPVAAPEVGTEGTEGVGEMEVSSPARVVLVWEGIGQLHKGFFSDAAATTALAAGLGPWLRSTVDVTVRYDERELVGDILIKLAPDQLVRPPAASGDRIRLQDLAPITTVLAAYRSTIAGRFDYRIESFRVSLESYRGARVCQLSLAGPPPPDGTLISPCVTINGQQHCGEATAEGVTFSSAVAADLRACLDIR